MDENLPIIVGVGQVTQRPEAERPREPLALMAEAARIAEADSGGGDLLHALDSVRVVNSFSWPSKAPAHDLSRALAVSPREQLYTHLGGNTPQWQVNEVAERIHDGDLRLALIAGAEAVYSARRARTRGVDLGWSPRGNPAPDIGDGRPGVNDYEAMYEATLPTRVYPLFENALRAHYGETIEAHQATIGAMMAKFSDVAATNPHAWFREARAASEIAEAGPNNRYIAFPYPKFMNSILDVDQGAALLMTSVGEARRLGIPEAKWVYVWGCGDATDHWYITERIDFFSSPAIRAAGTRAMTMAGVAIEEIDVFDLYSCFPSAVQITRDMLGISPDDGRPLTVTGGLPYFGGPGNNYVTHSISAMTEHLRAHRGQIGLVTANGWYITKHSIGIYSTEPPRGEWKRTAPSIDQAIVDAEAHPAIADAPTGTATVETYTVLFDRDGAPEKSIVVGRTPDGERFLATTGPDKRILEAMTKREMIGTTGRVTQSEDERNVFVPG